MTKKTKWLKSAFFLFLVLTVYYTFVWLVLPLFADPQLHSFEKYSRVWNWDLKQHARGDFDQDGQEDLISFTGCAFLSSVVPNMIPEDRQCMATGIAALSFNGQDERIGQKYIETDDFDLNLNLLSKGLPITHSFIAKDAHDNWKIFVNSRGNLKIFKVQNSGLLENVDDVTISNRIDEFLYSISQFFIIFALPLIPISLIFNSIFEPFRPITTQAPIYEVTTLSTITIIIYVLWRKSISSKH